MLARTRKIGAPKFHQQHRKSTVDQHEPYENHGPNEHRYRAPRVRFSNLGQLEACQDDKDTLGPTSGASVTDRRQGESEPRTEVQHRLPCAKGHRYYARKSARWKEEQRNVSLEQGRYPPTSPSLKLAKHEK